jgi:hypothetical protein
MAGVVLSRRVCDMLLEDMDQSGVTIVRLAWCILVNSMFRLELNRLVCNECATLSADDRDGSLR